MSQCTSVQYMSGQYMQGLNILVQYMPVWYMPLQFDQYRHSLGLVVWDSFIAATGTVQLHGVHTYV